MIRRIAAMLLLGVTVSAQAAPVAAAPPRCALPRAAAARACPRCDVNPQDAHRTAISAASCCRFGASEPVTRAPGVVPSIAPSPAPGSVAALSAASHASDGLGTPHPIAPFEPARSTGTPFSLHTALRL